MKEIIKNFLRFMAIAFMFLITISGALAFNIDSDDEYIMSPDDSIFSSFAIIDYFPDEDIIIQSSTDWISFSDTNISKELILNDAVIFEEEVIFVKYFIDIPVDSDVGVYREQITVSSGGIVDVVNVKIDIKNEFFLYISNLTKKPIFWYAFMSLIFILLISYIFYSYIKWDSKSTSKHKKNTGMMILKILLGIGVIVSVYLFVFQTNIIMKHQDTDFERKVSFDLPSDIDGGYLKIVESENTPSAVEWASFNDGDKYIFFSVNGNGLIEEEVFIVLPEVVESGYYSFKVSANFIEGNEVTTEIEKTVSFKVN